MIIGLTGGIATGKNSAAKIMSKLGAKVIDADKISHALTKRGEPLLKEIALVFGKEILTKCGSLNRYKLGKIVFSNKKAKIKLEKILHKRIIAQIKADIKKVNKKNIVLNVPLLFETGLEKLCDKTIVVWVPLNIQAKRLMLRDKISLKDAQNKIFSQMPIEKKMKKADFVVDNGGSKALLAKQVKNLYKLLTAKKN